MRRASVALALAALGLLPSFADAHGPLATLSVRQERELRLTERAALGFAHAREHAVARAAARQRAARLRAMAPPERRAWSDRRLTREGGLVAAAQAGVAGQPKDEVGAWSPRYGLPDYVMHAALLHTGEVAMWGWLPYGEPDEHGVARRPLRGENWFWDTAKPLPSLTAPDAAGAFRHQDAPQISIGGETQTPPLYCSGVSFLPDGRLLIAGGNRAFTEEDPEDGNGWKGLDTLFLYDPATKTWTQGPTMQRGRWYPTQLMLSDGRTWIAGGYDELGFEGYVEDAELLNAAADALDVLPSPAPAGDDAWGDVGWPGLYPHAWVMPGGRVLVVPREWSRASALLEPDTLVYTPDPLDPWTQRPEREGATAVLLPDGTAPSHRVLQLGGFAYFQPDGTTLDGQASPATRVLDQRQLSSPSPWSPGAPLQVGRSYHNTVLLPGGGMVTVGGGAGNDNDGDSGLYFDGNAKAELLNVELFDPATQSWRLGAPQQSFRAYHSVALLLPDGRVWSAGDDWHQDLVRDETGSPWRGNAEIYSPPYLFGGLDPATGAFDPNRQAQRTEIADGPSRLGWGGQAAVTTSSDDVASMVLVAPAAVTHSIDTNQRHVGLEIAGRTPGLGVTVRLPGDATTAPPGWYMLFALNGCGTPSHARWVRVGTPSPGDPPPLTPQPWQGAREGAATCGPVEQPPGPPGQPPTVPAPLGPSFPPADMPRPPQSAPRLSVEPLRATRKRLRERGRLDLRVHSERAGRIQVRALLRRAGRKVVLGRTTVVLRGSGSSIVHMRLSRKGFAWLRGGRPLTLTVEASAAGQRRAVSSTRL